MSNGVSQKGELAQQSVVRYIWDNSLRRGDRLPSCAALARLTGLGEATVFRAVKKLEISGVVEFRDKVGLFVKDPRTPGMAGYQIGIIAGNENWSAVNNTISATLQRTLAQSGCAARLFHGAIGNDSAHENTLDLHIGVKAGIERGEIHALLLLAALSEDDWEFLRVRRIPVCYLGGFTYAAAHYAVTVDLGTFAGNALQALDAGKFRQPLLFLPPLDDPEPAYAVWRDRDIIRYNNYTEADALAAQLLLLPPEKRPDALVLPDSILAQALYSSLVRVSGVTYLPHPLVLSPAELPFFLPVPDIDLLQYSINNMSAEAVSLLLQLLRSGATDNPIRTETPILRSIKEGDNL